MDSMSVATAKESVRLAVSTNIYKKTFCTVALRALRTANRQNTRILRKNINISTCAALTQNVGKCFERWTDMHSCSIIIL